MKNKELKKILVFLQLKNNQFFKELEEFGQHLSTSFEPLEPVFKYDLSLFREEMIHNIANEEQSNVSIYYKNLIGEFLSDNYVISVNGFHANNSFIYYESREGFLNEYYMNNPDNGLGEGELDFIKICFEGFLYSYSTVIDEVIKTIESNIPMISLNINQGSGEKHEKSIASESSKRDKLSDEEIDQIITKHTKYLSGVNRLQVPIMEQNEYMRLVESIKDLIKNDKPDEKLKPFNLNGITQLSIKYTLYQIHKDIFSKWEKDNFILFLMKAFPKLTEGSTFKTLKTKFSASPKIVPF